MKLRDSCTHRCFGGCIPRIASTPHHIDLWVCCKDGKCLKEFEGNVTGELKQWRRASVATVQAAAQGKGALLMSSNDFMLVKRASSDILKFYFNGWSYLMEDND